MQSKFSERLKELRLQAGLTQEQLSKELGGTIDQSTIALWENKKRVPNFDSVLEIAVYFGVSLDYLGGLED